MPVRQALDHLKQSTDIVLIAKDFPVAAGHFYRHRSVRRDRSINLILNRQHLRRQCRGDCGMSKQGTEIVRPGRSSVVVKKNHSAATQLFMAGAAIPASRCST